MPTQVIPELFAMVSLLLESVTVRFVPPDSVFTPLPQNRPYEPVVPRVTASIPL